MPRGRVAIYTSEPERLEARRARVRNNVRRWRSRQAELKSRTGPGQEQHPGGPRQVCPHEELARDGSERDDDDGLRGPSHANKSALRSRPVTPSALEDSRLLAGLAHRDLFLRLLLDCCMPKSGINVAIPASHERPRSRPAPCQAWMTAAYESSGRHGVLLPSMLTASLFVLGAERKDGRLLLVARQSYQRLLRLVQGRLVLETTGSSSASKSSTATAGPDPAILMTCLWLAMIEMLANNSFVGYETHLDGITDILRHAGPRCLAQSRVLRSVFFEHRLMYVASACMREEAPFFVRRAWLDFPGRETCDIASTPLNRMVDITCGLLEILQGMRVGVETLSTVLTRTQEVFRQLSEWHQSHFGDGRGVILAEEQESDSSTIHFSDFNVAVTLLWYHSFRLRCTLTIGRVCEQLLTETEGRNSRAQPAPPLETITLSRSTALTDTVDSARFICRSMEYMGDRRRGIAGPMVGYFPICTAVQGFESAHDNRHGDFLSELDWARRAVKRFENRYIETRWLANVNIFTDTERTLPDGGK